MEKIFKVELLKTKNINDQSRNFRTGKLDLRSHKKQQPERLG